MTNCTALSTVGFVPLSRGMLAMVDANDLPVLSRVRWNAHDRCGRSSCSTSGLMHRHLMDPPAGQMIDHKNGNPLDNRRSNLRFATHQDNMRNRRKRGKFTSKYKGVCLDLTSKRRPWQAQMTVNRKTVHLGRYASEELAALAYDAAAATLHGEFACLNFAAPASTLTQEPTL